MVLVCLSFNHVHYFFIVHVQHGDFLISMHIRCDEVKELAKRLPVNKIMGHVIRRCFSSPFTT